MDLALGFIIGLIVYFAAHCLYTIYKQRPRPQFGDANGLVEVKRGWPDEESLLPVLPVGPSAPVIRAFEITDELSGECYQHHDWLLREDGYWCPTCEILRQPIEGVKDGEWRRGLHND